MIWNEIKAEMRMKHPDPVESDDVNECIDVPIDMTPEALEEFNRAFELYKEKENAVVQTLEVTWDIEGTRKPIGHEQGIDDREAVLLPDECEYHPMVYRHERIIDRRHEWRRFSYSITFLR